MCMAWHSHVGVVIRPQKLQLSCLARELLCLTSKLLGRSVKHVGGEYEEVPEEAPPPPIFNSHSGVDLDTPGIEMAFNPFYWF